MHHGVSVNPSVGEMALSASSGDKPTSFGVLFHQEPKQPADFLLGLLGRSNGAMLDGPPAGDDAPIPAGFTFFGQFVDHDITLMSAPPTLGLPQDLSTMDSLRNKCFESNLCSSHNTTSSQ